MTVTLELGPEELRLFWRELRSQHKRGQCAAVKAVGVEDAHLVERQGAVREVVAGEWVVGSG